MKQLGTRVVGEPCPLCGQKVEIADQDGDTIRLWCSEFCSDTTDAEKEAYVVMQEGSWGYWPCSFCGCIIEDAFTTEFTGTHTSNTICGGCGPKVRLHYRTELLEEVLKVITVPGDLRARIQLELDGGS